MTGRPWIQICNERLLPRFGVDRLLALAGRYFSANGIEVSYACLRYQSELLDGTDTRILQVKVPPGQDIGGTERLVTQAILKSWLVRRPDVILIGGWPFFELAARAPSVGVPSIFIDAGAVPLDGLEGDKLWPQLELRRHRKAYLPSITQITPISNFIRDSQTIPDRTNDAGVTTVLLGADHLRVPLQSSAIRSSVVEAVERHRAAGNKLVLNLGRFEVQGYKNSHCFFDVLAAILKAGIATTGLVLAEVSEIDIPVGLRPHVICLGHTTDAELQAIIAQTDLGLSLSLWEGFNLPLVEMQNAGIPALAFNLGAHPEVVAHPWQLCSDKTDMILRAVRLLRGDPILETTLGSAMTAFQTRLPWSSTVAGWLDAVQVAREAIVPVGRRMLLVDVTNSARDPANSGVIRVTRHLTRKLTEDPRFDVIFMRWDFEHTSYVPVNRKSNLGDFGGPENLIGSFANERPPHVAIDVLLRGRDPFCAAPPVALLPEVTLDGSLRLRMSWLRYRGILITSILYDLIPINHPELCDPAVVEGFSHYLDEFRRVDQCIAISTTSLSDFVTHARATSATLPHRLLSLWLPAQLGDQPRISSLRPVSSDELRILCVSTLEPRKNHLRLLQAFEILTERRPELRPRLILIGNAYAGLDDTVNHVRAAQARGLPVDWLGVVTDDELARQYGRARFTVYPSLVEGFGMPILESLWMGRPSLCSNTGVMAELAEPGGCLTADMFDAAAIFRGLDRLANDEGLYARLVQEAVSRPLSTWDDYGQAVGSSISGLANLSPSSETESAPQRDIVQDLLQSLAA